MSLSPGNILAKLEELKKWQEKQQERLLEQHHKRLQHNDLNSNAVPVETDRSPPKATNKHVPVNERANATTKPKQPFLRRGAGLVRFGMGPGQQFTPFKTGKRFQGRRNIQQSLRAERGVAIPTENDTINEKGKDVSEHDVINNSIENRETKVRFRKPIITPLKRPDLSIKSKAAWCVTSDSQNDEQAPAVSAHNGVDACSNEIQISEEPSMNTSDRDLLVFEALEQRATQSSFCSTNSSIVHLLSSTPTVSPLKATRTATAKQFQAVYAQKFNDEQRFVKNFTNFDQTAQEEIDESNDNFATPLPNTQSTQSNIDEFERKLTDEYLSLIEKVLQFKQCAAENSSASSVTSEDVETTYESTLQAETNFNDKTKWTEGDDTESVCSSSSSSKVSEQQGKCNAETMTEAADNSDLQNKLREVESELKSVRLESGKTNKLKAQLEQQQKEFERHKREVLKQVDDEKLRINHALEEEKRKLLKEKMVFERYVKDLQNKPSKKEREEMSALKTEIATLQETLKLKETKNGLAQARLRNQIKSLEKENAALKTEIENLNRQNARLVASQKLNRKPSDTKILHQINKNLTKLTQEQISKQISALNKDSTSSEEDDHGPIVKPKETVRLKKPSMLENKENSKNLMKLTQEQISKQISALNKDSSSSDEDNHGPTVKPKETVRLKKPSMLENKENNKNISISPPSTGKNVNAIEEIYEQAFGIKTYEVPQRLSTGNTDENKKSEQILSDGTKQIKYGNGNVKTVSADGNRIILKYYNGDIKETNLLEGTVRYHYCDSKVNHTTNANGTELIEFPDGQIERHLQGGICEVQYTNGVVRRTKNDGVEEISYPDGTTVTTNVDGERVLQLPNGQKEVHTKEHKRREYPDGTVKILYPDGLQETRYTNGRIRLKDKHGNLLMDSHDNHV